MQTSRLDGFVGGLCARPYGDFGCNGGCRLLADTQHLLQQMLTASGDFQG